MFTRRSLFGLLLLAISALPRPGISAEPYWPQFRGADRTAISSDRGLLTEWGADGPKLVWDTQGLGRGYSSLAIADGRLITMGDQLPEAESEGEFLICLNVDSGEVQWKTPLGKAWNSGPPPWQSSRSTPTIDGDYVYALTAYGDLFCVETKTGKEVWKKNLKDDFEGRKGDSWGYSESVLIDGDRLICTPGGPKQTIVALNKKTGELVWSTAREGDRGAGHASVVISEIGGKRVYVQSTASGPMGVLASDGTLQWTYDIDRTTAVIPTPIVRNDLVFFTAGYGRGGALLRQVAGGEGVTVEEVYPLNRELANKHGGVVLVGDYLYGDSDDRGILWCAELATGEIKWKKRGSGRNSASVAAADGRLYVRYSNGVMTLVEESSEEFREVAAFTIPGSGERPGWAHPVVTGGKLFLREQNRVLCYDVTAK